MNNLKRKRQTIKNNDIIEAILNANLGAVKEIIQERPDAINSIHGHTKMNAAMLAAYVRLQTIFDVLIEYAGGELDFRYVDLDGDDLQEVAFSTLDPDIIDSVQAAYERYAPHIINNWPEP